MTPNQASENKQDELAVSETLPPQDEQYAVVMKNSAQHRATGEHPPVRATSTDNEAVSLGSIPSASELTSTNLQNSEPEDTLPDYLDQHR